MPLLICKGIDHSTVGKTLHRLSADYVTMVLKHLHLEIEGILQEGVFIADSTGIETDRYEDDSVLMRTLRKHEFRKLHVITDYFPGYGIISVVCAGETNGHAHDSPSFREIFDPALCHDGLLLGDSAYEALENLKLAYENGLRPVIKPRRQEHKARTKGIRVHRRAAKDYDETIYKKYRGIVEGLFGGLATRYDNKTRSRHEHTRPISILLMALAYNIRAYTRALAIVEITQKKNKNNTKTIFYIELFDNPRRGPP